MKKIIFPEKETAVLEDVGGGIPDPGNDEVTVQSIGCGICQVEIKQYKGLLDTSFPVEQLGHESVGFVTKVGSEISHLKEGDFVTTLWAPGFHEFFNVRGEWAVKIEAPGSDPSIWISEPASCALNGYLSADVRAGDRVLLLGCGYMGLLLAQIFRRSAHKEFVVCDRVQSKLDNALNHGATGIINGLEEDVTEVANASGGFDIVIEATGAPNIIQTAVDCVRVGGKVVVFADHRHHTAETVNWEPFITRAVTLAVSNPGSHPDFPGVWRQSVELMKAGHFDQSQLITHKWNVKDCAEAMQVCVNPGEDYIKGYFSWE